MLGCFASRLSEQPLSGVISKKQDMQNDFFYSLTLPADFESWKGRSNFQ